MCEAHHAAVIQRVVKRGAGEYQPVDQRDGQGDRRPARDVLLQTTGVTPVQVEHARCSDVVVVGHGDYEWLTVLHKADMRDEPRSKNRWRFIRHSAFGVALQPRARLPGCELHERLLTRRMAPQQVTF